MERYKQAARTGLLSEVLQEGAALFGALLIKCPLPVSFTHRCQAVARWLIHSTAVARASRVFAVNSSHVLSQRNPLLAREGVCVAVGRAVCKAAGDEIAFLWWHAQSVGDRNTKVVVLFFS